MAHHTYRIEATSAAPLEVVFAVLADGPGWASWAPSVGHASYEREGDPPPHGVGAIRRFGARVGPKSREEVVGYVEPSFFAYVALSGPIPLHGYRSEVRLAPTAAGGTSIEWTGAFDSWAPGMGAFIRRLVGGFARGLVQESERQASTPPNP